MDFSRRLGLYINTGGHPKGLTCMTGRPESDYKLEIAQSEQDDPPFAKKVI